MRDDIQDPSQSETIRNPWHRGDALDNIPNIEGTTGFVHTHTPVGVHGPLTTAGINRLRE